MSCLTFLYLPLPPLTCACRDQLGPEKMTVKFLLQENVGGLVFQTGELRLTLRGMEAHGTGHGSELPGNNLFEYLATPQVLIKNTSPISPRREAGMAKTRKLALSPRTYQWQRWKASSQVFLIPVSSREKINATVLGQEVQLSSVLALGCFLGLYPAALRPSEQPRHLLAPDRVFRENKGEVLLLYLRS